MASMGYQEAANIRKKKLSDTIAGRLVEGEGIGSSFTKSISERTKANMTGFKQKVDYLNIAKKLTGGSNLAPALLGRLTGRNSDSIRFFSGKGSAKPVSDKATKIEGGGSEQVEAMQETLDEIYGFLKDTREENEQKKVEAEGKKEEIELEKKRKHDELMKLLGVDTSMPTATKITETPKEESNSFLDMLMGALGNPKFWASLVTRVPFLLFLWGLWEAKQHLDSIEFGDKMKKNEGRIAEKAFREKQTDFSGLKITQDEAKAILEQPESPAKVRDIASFGGIERIQAIADGKPDPGGVAPKQKTYEENRQEVLPATVEPRPVGDSGKIKAKQADWDRKNSKDYNTDGTKKKITPVESKDTENKQVTPEVKTPNSPIPSEPASAKVSTVISESQDLQIPTPVVDAVKSVNNTVVNSQSTSQVATLPIPSVRNQEPTYQEMVLYSTRVV
jgi:hypothetical protein